MRYSEALAYIASLRAEGWRLSLDRIEELLRRVGNPQNEAGECLHVAGTNGKGSVTAMIQSILTTAGYRAGGYFSPYVYDFRERIQLNCELIPKRSVTALVEKLAPISESLAKTYTGRPTEFEFKTAMGFLFWKKERCDYVALEVGLGGRLDATNVVIPAVSVITEIGMDHQKQLGNTIEAIATEKAGIIKQGRPVVSAVSNSKARKVIEDRARELGCRLWQYGRDFVLEGDSISTPARTIKRVKPGVLGSVQMRNAATAVAAIEMAEIVVSTKDMRFGLRNTVIPGRMEVVSRRPLILFDGAHNPQAAKIVGQVVREEFDPRRLILVFSGSAGHDTKTTLSAFRANRVHAAPMENPRGLSARRLKGILPSRGVFHETLGDALLTAISDAGRDDVILVSGSFYLLSEAKDALMKVGIPMLSKGQRDH